MVKRVSSKSQMYIQYFIMNCTLFIPTDNFKHLLCIVHPMWTWKQLSQDCKLNCKVLKKVPAVPLLQLIPLILLRKKEKDLRAQLKMAVHH